jgi:hypothetical protein
VTRYNGRYIVIGASPIVIVRLLEKIWRLAHYTSRRMGLRGVSEGPRVKVDVGQIQEDLKDNSIVDIAVP